MSADAYITIPYAVARVGIWLLLLAAAATDGVMHRHVRSRGWQLFAMLCAAVALFVVRNLAFLAMVVEGHHNEAGLVQRTYGGFIFFSDLADSYWIFLLMALSAGYCITRNTLSPHRAVCITIPIVFFITSIVVDYVLFSTTGLGAFAYGMAESSRLPVDDPSYDPTKDPLAQAASDDSVWSLAFVMCMLAKMMSFLLAWFFMYDTARMEHEALSAPPEEAAAAAPAPGTTDADGVGHRAVPSSGVLLEEGQNASHLYGDVTADDLDAPKTVQDRLADRDKARLMRSFFYAVCVYITAAMVVFFLPAIVPGGGALMIFLDCLLWAFAAALLVVFRMREGNQFLLLDEEGAGGMETSTELGVLTQREDRAGNGGGGGGALPQLKPFPARFTLGDEEEGGGGGGGAGGVNASAAAHGVVIRPVPSGALPSPR